MLPQAICYRGSSVDISYNTPTHASQESSKAAAEGHISLYCLDSFRTHLCEAFTSEKIILSFASTEKFDKSFVMIIFFFSFRVF